MLEPASPGGPDPKEPHMDLRSSRAAVLLVTLVALLAGTVGATLGSLGPAVGAVAAGHHGDGAKSKGLTRHKVSKLAAKQVAKLVPQLTAKNSTTLGGQTPDAFRTSAFTVAVKDFAGTNSVVDRTLPAVPAGTYQVSVALSATVSGSGVSLLCSLYQDGVAADLITAYGATYSSWRTISATRAVAVSGTLHLQCQALATSGTPTILAIPANPKYAPAQVSFVKLDSATALPDAG